MTTEVQLSEQQVAAGLVTRILAGDRQAESEMVERYHRGLIAMLFNRSRDRSLAEDIAQETWLLAIQKIRSQQLRDPQKLASFIVQIGKNQLIMHYRKVSAQSGFVDSDVSLVADAIPNPEQHLDNRQLGVTLARLLGEMHADRDAQLLQRFYLQGDSKQALCSEFQLSNTHFDRVLYRARDRFKKLWLKCSEGPL